MSATEHVFILRKALCYVEGERRRGELFAEKIVPTLFISPKDAEALVIEMKDVEEGLTRLIAALERGSSVFGLPPPLEGDHPSD